MGEDRRRPTASLLAFALALLALGALASPAAARQKLDVPWTFDAGVKQQQQRPNSAPAGANDYGCRSRRHPEPVVLVHGLAANRTVNWATISPYLKNRGFCVFALTYGTKRNSDLGFYQPGGLKRMQRSAKQLKRFIRPVLKRTGAEKVDIVGHSEGSLMPSWYVRFLGGGRVVDDYVGMTTLWGGTNLAGLSNLTDVFDTLGIGGPAYAAVREACASCKQFLRGSNFFRKLNGRGVFSRRVYYTSIVTKNDELVFPYTSGLAPRRKNTRNVILQNRCKLDQAEHVSVAADPVTAGFIYKALDRKRAPKPPCVPVLPFVGAPTYTGN